MQRSANKKTSIIAKRISPECKIAKIVSIIDAKKHEIKQTKENSMHKTFTSLFRTNINKTKNTNCTQNTTGMNTLIFLSSKNRN